MSLSDKSSLFSLFSSKSKHWSIAGYGISLQDSSTKVGMIHMRGGGWGVYLCGRCTRYHGKFDNISRVYKLCCNTRCSHGDTILWPALNTLLIVSAIFFYMRCFINIRTQPRITFVAVTWMVSFSPNPASFNKTLVVTRVQWFV